MASTSQLRSLGRFLYTQNPFYLISCFLILYGLQIATIANGDLVSRSILLTASMAAYSLLMAVTCVAVVRLGKVWEDARSIFLVVIISQVALSTGLDELCISDWRIATCLLLLAAAFTFLITELIIRCCRLKFPAWYRLSYYALLCLFFLMPIVLGYAVGNRQITLTNWGAPLFSTLVGGGLLLLIPAIRKAEALVRENGTPWCWPFYPLTAYVILIVLAGIRTHAIWMSFGFTGGAVRFEPFLLMPIVLAILVLVIESDTAAKASARTYIAMALAPAMWLCGISRGGMTHLPIQADLGTYFGSAQTIALVALVGFYLYVWIRGVAGSGFAVVATLLALSGLSDLPDVAQSAGFRHWMFALVASALSLIICLRKPVSDRKWLAFTMVTAVTILMAGHDYHQTTWSMIGAAVFTVSALMMIGAFFETELAVILRHVSAAMLVIAAIGIVGWHLTESPGINSHAVLAGMAVVSIVYMQIVRRLGWIYVFGIQAACLSGLLAWNGFETGSLSQTNWPIHTGMLCFVIGLTITSVKTGVHRRFWRQLPRQPRLGHYQSGL